MRNSAVAAITVLMVSATAVRSAGQKPDSTPDWRCQIVFRDAAGDAIKSDTTPGSAAWPKPYRDGVDGVGCIVINEEGVAHHQFLHLTITGTRRKPSPRFIQFVGQSHVQPSGSTATYSTFGLGDQGTFEVKKLAAVEWNPADPTRRDVMPFRAYFWDSQFPDGYARLDGDSNFTGDITGNINWDTTSSVFVQPLNACSWQITSYTSEELFLFDGEFGERTSTRTDPRVMRMTEGIKKPRVRGDFPMPFQATISIIGNKAGCPLF